MVLAALTLALGEGRPGGSAPGAVSLPPEAATTAQRFLDAFSRNDREAIGRMLPRRPENLYGPCPFARMPTLRNPRVDSRVGGVEFEGSMSDPSLPRQGLMVLRLVEEGGARTWRVRQIYWYDELPPEADLPKESPTPADRRQEASLREAAGQFIAAWLRGDWERMEALTFRWWEVPRRPPRWVQMTRVELEGRPTTLDGVRVDFVVRLRLLRLMPRRVHGNLWMVREEGVWRVRPLTFSLWF